MTQKRQALELVLIWIDPHEVELVLIWIDPHEVEYVSMLAAWTTCRIVSLVQLPIVKMSFRLWAEDVKKQRNHILEAHASSHQ